MFSFKSKILAISIGSMLTLAACNAQDANKSATSGGSVATVNGSAISQARLDLLLKQARQQGQPDTPDLRKKIQDNLIIQEVVAQEAIKNGLDKSADVLTRLDLAKQSVLINAFLQEHVKNNAVSDVALKAEYERIKSQRGDSKQYHARHILVESEAEAKSIIAQLKKDPKKFEKLAGEKSKDPGSKVKGGDLGWVDTANLVPEFSAAMTKLQKGQLTAEPVKSQFGWHVIKLEDSRTMQAPPFEEVKQEIQQYLQQQQIDKMIADLRAKAKIVETAAADKK